jgi:dTDP-4-amino-4,6-dideoxygalactose transaminase
MPVAFIDLQAQAAVLGDRLTGAMARVLAHGAFIGGPEVKDFERRLAAFADVAHAISCGNGTDALHLVMLAERIGQGDAVLVPSFTFVASAEIVPLNGATPVFVDVHADTFNMDPASLEAGIGHAKRLGLRPRAVIPVDLFGQPADYDRIVPIARANGMVVIADAAQSFGATYNGRPVGGLADYTTTSFFPSKPLGCYGDGGAILTNDDEKAALLRSIAVHGKGSDKYDNVRIGVNSRMDTLQAAILLQKLEIFTDEIVARERIARAYSDALREVVETPELADGVSSVWAQYTIKVPNRDRFAARLKADGIPTAVYYPIPMHRQTGYRDFPAVPGGLTVSEALSASVVSLPMHPYLDEQTQAFIVKAVREAVALEAA